MAKRYYWLKLKDDFFDKKEIKRLRRMAGGDTYTIIYLKMLLLSMKDEGCLFFDNIGDDFVDELSLQIDEDMDNTKMTLQYLQSKGLLEIKSDDEFYLNELSEMIGSETDSAERKRQQRKGLEENKRDNVTLESRDSHTEKEREIEKEIDIDNIPYVEIINYLNGVAEKNYKSTTKKTKGCIKARHNEGFSIDDFKKVIDNKTAEWLNDKEMNKFLRPETLFGNKFEGYLNQDIQKVRGEIDLNEFDLND